MRAPAAVRRGRLRGRRTARAPGIDASRSGKPAQAEEVHRAQERREAVHRGMRGVELPGVEREDRRLAALAERPLGRRERGVREASGRASPSERERPAEDASRQRRDLDERPALAARCDAARRDFERARAAAPASSRRRSGTRRMRARAGPPRPGGGSTTPPRGGRRPARPRPSSIESRAREQVLPELARPSSRRRGGGRSPWTPISWPRRAASRARSGYRRAIQPEEEDRGAVPARREEVEEAAEGRLDPGRETSPSAPVGVVVRRPQTWNQSSASIVRTRGARPGARRGVIGVGHGERL